MNINKKWVSIFKLYSFTTGLITFSIIQLHPAMSRFFIIMIILANSLSCRSQAAVTVDNMKTAAIAFVRLFSESQQKQATFDFTDPERFNWQYVPVSRKGIPLRDLNSKQHAAGMQLLRTVLSDTGYGKTIAITQLEDVLRTVENRGTGDDYRNSGKYFFCIFGNPSTDSVWAWRFEGHHVSFSFSSLDRTLVSATPGFLGSNPAVVLTGPQKGKQVLKEETEVGFKLLNSLNEQQMKQAVISADAPGEILTGSSRKAMLEDPRGLLYSDMTTAQQQIFLQLLGIYVRRYSLEFSKRMMNDIEAAGLKLLRFTWAGEQAVGPGHPHYYRIQGPTLLIEYDNTQNNANHVHTVVRDLKNDFGGDQLLEHYKKHKHH